MSNLLDLLTVSASSFGHRPALRFDGAPIEHAALVECVAKLAAGFQSAGLAAGDRLVLLSSEEYARLKRRSRDVIRPGQLTDEERGAIAAAAVPAEYAALDGELKSWTP